MRAILRARTGERIRDPRSEDVTSRDLDLCLCLLGPNGASDGIDGYVEFPSEEARKASWAANKAMVMSLRDDEDRMFSFPSGNRPQAWWDYDYKREAPHGPHVGSMLDLAEFEYLRDHKLLFESELAKAKAYLAEHSRG